MSVSSTDPTQLGRDTEAGATLPAGPAATRGPAWATRELAAGDLVGRYVILARVGAGGMDIRRERFGPDSVFVGHTLASAERRRGNLRPALAAADEAVRVIVAARGPGHPEVATIHHVRASILIDLGDVEAGRAALVQALGQRDRDPGFRHPDVREALVEQVRAELAAGDVPAAAAALARADAYTLPDETPAMRGDLEFVRARALTGQGDEAGARRAAAAAEAAYAAVGQPRAQELAAVRAWQAAHK